MNELNLPRMRTISEAAQEIKALDPRTAITEYHIRQLAVSGVIPRVKAGKKYLINLDMLIEYMSDPTSEKFRPHPTATVNGIRRVG
ncbi:hypothetical protein [Ruminococcus sp.]|uniref:hypothetical protein n=1 Tax=Ruminococcus sp. TaxID=41978 RepID=UPI00388D2C5A